VIKPDIKTENRKYRYKKVSHQLSGNDVVNTKNKTVTIV